MERLQQLSYQVVPGPAHPFDPLSTSEIDTAVAIVRREHGNLNFNAVTLAEPRKAEMLRWLASPESTPRPVRAADVVAIGLDGKVYDGIVDLVKGEIVKWQHTEGVQPLITMEDLQEVEHVVRQDEGVIEQCGILGIPREDMHKVYCDRTSLYTSYSYLDSVNKDSMDDWIRRTLWKQDSPATSPHVLPASCGRLAVYISPGFLPYLQRPNEADHPHRRAQCTTTSQHGGSQQLPRRRHGPRRRLPDRPKAHPHHTARRRIVHHDRPHHCLAELEHPRGL